MSGRFTKLISTLLCYFLLFEQCLPAGRQAAFAQVAGALDISGHLAQLHSSLFPDKFRPLHLRYLSYDNIANSFKLLLDKGDLKNLQESALTDTTKTLLNYFFVGITLPNESFWVNLRPDSEDNVIDEELAKTDVGKILLEADLQLKKDTALFTSPETPQGKEYWDKLYKKAEELFGSENITIPTLTRPWIVPNEIIIRETENNAYIYKATLKVMLEEDYLKGNAAYNFKDERFKTLNEYSSQLLRELIIPKLTKEINSAKRYAPLRQVYYSLIMAQWFKTKFYGKGGLYSWLIDKKNLNGLTSKTPWSKTTYFQAYQKSFKEGEYNLKVPVYTAFGQSLRSYMSGGIQLEASSALEAGKVAGSPIRNLPDNLLGGKHYFPANVGGDNPSNFGEVEIKLGHKMVSSPMENFGVQRRLNNGLFPVEVSVEKYLKLSDEEKEYLRRRFEETFKPHQPEVDRMLYTPPETYPLIEDDRMEELLKTAETLLSMYPNSRIVSVGRTPLWFLETARLLEFSEGVIVDRYIYAAFSGRWYKKSGDIPRPGHEGPNGDQIMAYRTYLSTIELDPITIVDKEEQTVFVDYAEQGESIASFLSILLEWADELGLRDILKKKIVVHILQYPELKIYLDKFSIVRQPVDFELVRDLANSNAFEDSMGVYYPYQRWSEINPLEEKISENANLVYFRIIDFLAQKGLLLPNKDLGFCLTPDSLITLADGTTKPLIELKPFTNLRGSESGSVGDMVLSLNEQTGKLEPHRVNALLDMGVKPVYRITTSSGKTLKTTLTHPYLTKDGWKKLQEIKAGEEIAVVREINGRVLSLHSSGVRQETLKLAQKPKIQKPLIKLTSLTSFFLGLNKDAAGKEYQTCNRQESLQYRRESLKEITRQANSKNSFSQIRDYLGNKFPAIPSYCLHRSKIYHIVKWLSRLLSIPNVEAGQVREIASDSGILWDKIVSIEPLGPMQVYDIEVEGTHNFIAQGILAHNTYASASPLKKGDWQPFEPPDSSFVRKNQEAFAYDDAEQDFWGVDLEHFVWAQNILVEHNVPPGAREIYKKLTQGKDNKKIIDLIIGRTYQDPRLKIEIIGQNKNPRKQAVLEAIANSLDALGLSIGQFGKGVKQIIDWLEPTGKDRIDVFTKDSEGVPCQLTILKDTQGQNYIQIKTISIGEFQEAAGENFTQGTIVKVTVQSKIPRTDRQLDEKRRNSQESIVEAIHKRFPFVASVQITTQIGAQSPQMVNGFGEKKVIVPPQVSLVSARQDTDKRVQIKLTDNTITIIDNGKGMDVEVLARMFVPKQGTKHPEPLSGEAAKNELKKVKVVRDETLPHRVSFARNGEVVVAVDIPADIIEGATVAGGLMVELGSLLNVPESRDNIIIPLDLKPGEKSNFELAVEHAIREIINHPHLSDVDKPRYINTIIIGLEELIKGNENYAYTVKNIRASTRESLKEIVAALKKEGFVLLPHTRQFTKLAIPQDKKALFLNEYLFDWQGALGLKEIGGVIVPAISLEGEKRLPLVLVSFTKQSLEPAQRYNRDWHTLSQENRLPVVKTERFMAIPLNCLGSQKLLELIQKRFKGLSSKEEKEFNSLLQMVNIFTTGKVTTSYEVTAVERHLAVSDFKFEESIGEIDSQAINSFLAKPPEDIARAPTQVPTDANQRYVRLENGDVVEIGTGRKILDNVIEMEYLRNGYYRVVKILKVVSVDPGRKEIYSPIEIETKITEIIKLEDGNAMPVLTQVGVLVMHLSPDKRFAYVQLGYYGEIKSIFDLESGQKYSFENCYDLQFSRDGRYLTYRKGMPQIGSVELMIVSISSQGITEKKTIDLGGDIKMGEFTAVGVGNYESAINPFAHLVFVQNTSTKKMQLIDLETGKKVAEDKQIKHLLTDSTGIYTALIDTSENVFIYLHRTKKLLSAENFKGRNILYVSTFWVEGKVFYGAEVSGAQVGVSRTHYFDEDGASVSVDKYISNYLTEIILKSGEIRVQSITGTNIHIKDFDPLQRLDQKGIYKHPHFDLLIDNSDPDNPVAIDPKTGKKALYKGSIIAANNMNLHSYSDGRFYFSIFSSEETRKDYKHSSIWDPKELRFNITNNFSPPSTNNERKYIDSFLLFTYSIEKGVIRFRLPKYSSVSYDGKYFVFTNPKTGDVAYLNPKEPGEPIFVSAKPSAGLTEIKPSDAPDRLVIGKGESGNFIFDSATNKKIDVGQDIDHIERVNSSTFIVYDKSGDYKVFKIDESTPKLFFKDSRKDSPIIAHTDRLIVAQDKQQNSQIYDVKKERFYPRISDSVFKETHLSSSGRFSVHKNAQGGILYYDHNGAVPKAKNIVGEEQYQEYFVPKNSEVVILKDINGRYWLYNLLREKMQIREAEHIEIDSGGTIAVYKDDASRMGYLNLKTGDYDDKKDCIRVASDDKFIYVMVEDDLTKDEHAGVHIFNKEGEEAKPKAVGWEKFIDSYSVPRFWEEYALEAKRIWDREKNNRQYKISYKENSPTDSLPNKKMELFGEILILRIWGIATIVILTANETRRNILDVETRLDLLRRENVLFSSDENGNPLYPHIDFSKLKYDIYKAKSTKIFINQNKTFICIEKADMPSSILGNKKPEFFLIDADGDVIDISHQVHRGFVPTDVNGDYFVFSNPETGEIKYLDPRVVNLSPAPQTIPLTPEQEERQRQALELWENSILSRRQGFIEQARSAYLSFLDNVPEEFREELEHEIKQEINKLYEEQESEIRKRYQKALQGDPLDLDTPLPFDIFQKRMQAVRKPLSDYISLVQGFLSQEGYSVQREYYLVLFKNVFMVTKNLNLTLQEFDDHFFEVLAYHWSVTTQEQANAIPIIAEFISAIKNASSGQIKISEIRKMVEFLSYFSSRNPPENTLVVKEQLEKILGAKEGVKNKFLQGLRQKFAQVKLEALTDYLDNPQKLHTLGQVRPFVIFLTNKKVNLLKEKERFLPQGKDIALPEGGVVISQIVNLEQRRPKQAEDDVVMSIDYLLDQLLNLPPPSENLEKEITENTTLQAETGAYTREITQNSHDAGAGALKIRYYLQDGPLGKEFVEEAQDNGSGALEEAALLIPKSTKQEGQQIELSGFFGTGKYTIFEGVDRLEIITKNDKRAFLFILEVNKENGQPKSVRLTGIRELTDKSVEQGVTIRRIKRVDNTIPELDAMLSQDSWKIFAGFSQDKNFRIYIIDQEGKISPLIVEKKVLTEVDFAAVKPGEEKETNFGKLRIIAAKDMPLQIVDRAGLRVSEIKGEYLALIPSHLRSHFQELGLVIQIPLPLIRNRSAFEHENEYLPLIQKYAAIEFYKAIAYKALTQTSPQFVFDGLPLDWETNGDYWKSINLRDKTIVELAEKINRENYRQVSESGLKELLTEEGKLDWEKKFVKLILMLEVVPDKDKPQEKTSLLARRLAIQAEIDAQRAKEQIGILENIGLTAPAIPNLGAIPYYSKRISQAKGIEIGHKQMGNPEAYLVDPAQYTTQEQELVQLAFSLARHFGIEQVLLVSNEVSFAGAFLHYKGKHAMFLKRSIADKIGKMNLTMGAIDEATDTIIHELAHLLEEFAGADYSNSVWERGFLAHLSDFTHDAVGTFAEAMKEVSAVLLTNYGTHAQGIVAHNTYQQRPEEEKTASSAVGGDEEKNFELLKRALSDFKIPIELPATLKELTLNLIVQTWITIKEHLQVEKIKQRLDVGSLKDFVLSFKDEEALSEIGKTLANDVLFGLMPIIKEIEKKIKLEDFPGIMQEIEKVETALNKQQFLGEGVYGFFDTFEGFDNIGNTFIGRAGNDFAVISGTSQLAATELKEGRSIPDGAIGIINKRLLDTKTTLCKLCLRIPVQNLRERFLIWGDTVTPEVFKKIEDEIMQDQGLTEGIRLQNIHEFLIRIIEDTIGISKDGHSTKPKYKLIRDGIYPSTEEALKVDLKEYILRYKNSIMPLSELSISILNDLRKSGIDIENLRPVFKGCLLPMVFEAITNFWKDSEKQSRPIKDNAKDHLRPIIETFQKISENDWKSQEWFWRDLVYFMERSILELTEDENGQLKSRQLNRAFAKLGMDEEKQINKPPPSASSAVKGKKGGVDLRTLPIITEPVSMPALNGQFPSGTVPLLNLDEEWSQIQNMLNAGIIPSSQRLKEFLQASCESVDCAERTEDALGVIADILRLEEERVAVTEPALRELLVLLESDKPANELQLALSKITVLPKIPQRN